MRTRALRAMLAGAIVAVVLAVALAATTTVAHAGSVGGTLTYKPGRLGTPPVRNQGFVPRIENPFRPIRQYDPMPWLVVVLEGGTLADGDTSAPSAPVRYEILGESFATPVLPVVVGSSVEIKNRGFATPVLHTPDVPELLESVSIAPRDVHVFKVGEPQRAIVIRAEGAPHLQGSVVAFPHRHFAKVDSAGKFEMSGVPPGQWKVRVWYRDGWLKGVEQTVTVDAKRAAITLTLPPALEIEPPAASK